MVSELKPVFYFAYGSNMCSARLRNRVPSARPLAIGKITGYSLVFNKRSRDGSSKANAYFTGRESDFAWGVIFALCPSEKAALDQAEGLRYGYDETTVTVASGDGDVAAVMYYATDIDDSLLPYSWYVRFVVLGAREHSLPAPYIQSIERVAQSEDPDLRRDAENRAIGSDLV
jgi:gamma-glutamylcyclotransferase